MTRVRRSDTSRPGWTRRRAGSGFSYRDAAGVVLTGADRERCKALAIPPAWTDVWICPWPNGHVQAVGTDAAGRRQYLYHPAWREGRDRVKFARMLAFGEALPPARTIVAEHLGLPGMPRERALAAAFRLMDQAGLRVGGEAYAREHGTVGVATLRREHVATGHGQVRLQFPGKSGREHDLVIADPGLADALHAMLARRSGGPELLAFRREGSWVDLSSSDVNDYVREVTGAEVTAKDFRTWHGAVSALAWLATHEGVPSRRAVAAAMRDVADHLGNTPAVARSAYVDPRIVQRYLEGYDLPLAELAEGEVLNSAHEASGAEAFTAWEEALMRLLRTFSD